MLNKMPPPEDERAKREAMKYLVEIALEVVSDGRSKAMLLLLREGDRIQNRLRFLVETFANPGNNAVGQADVENAAEYLACVSAGIDNYLQSRNLKLED